MKKGDRVKLVGSYYDDNEDNPRWGGKYGHIAGTIVEVYSDDYSVQWDNGRRNGSYRLGRDLELLTSETETSLKEKVMSFIKKLLSPDDALVEKYFTKDGALDLGNAEVQAAIYKLVKPDLVAAAKAKEVEEKK